MHHLIAWQISSWTTLALFHFESNTKLVIITGGFYLSECGSRSDRTRFTFPFLRRAYLSSNTLAGRSSASQLGGLWGSFWPSECTLGLIGPDDKMIIISQSSYPKNADELSIPPRTPWSQIDGIGWVGAGFLFFLCSHSWALIHLFLFSLDDINTMG